jgi:PAS domain S-box-containing protein
MQEKIADIFQYNEYNLFVISTYNPWLILLSISIAILASYMGFQVAHQAANRSPIRKNLSLLVGSIVLGGGVWSMHFIGMLALELCTQVSYHFQLTTLSVIPSIAASWVALNLITRKNVTFQQLVFAGILVGSGISIMHYAGMAAMEMAPLLRYNLPIFGLSILVAISLAIFSLWISSIIDKKNTPKLTKNTKIAISSLVMGMAISGMHYLGMAAARFVLPEGMELPKQTSGISVTLVMAIAGITIIIIFLVLVANLMFRYKDKSISATNNERRLIATMDTAIDGIITIDSTGIVISVNKAVSTLLGWQPEELIGFNVKKVVPSPHQENHDQYIDNYLKTRKAKIIGMGREVDALTRHGETIPIRLGIGHVELNEEHMFVAFISDLRERKAMENKLRTNEAKIRALVTNIPGIAYRCLDTPGWPNLFINDEVEKVLGYPAKDFLLPDPKRSLGDFVHPDDIDKIMNANLRDPEGYQLDFRLIDRYKNVRWMLGYGRASKVENSDDYYLDGFIMDITDRKKMEFALVAEKEKAERAAATRAAFLANMSHEIRTPMNAIIGFSDILLDEELANNQRKKLSTINQSAKSLLHILNDVLDSAKLDKGKFQLEYRDFCLVEEVDSVISTLWLEAQNKGLEINLNIEKDAQRSYNGAPDRIRQVLTNIIGNAIKFTEQGNVSINISRNVSDVLTFTVSDTGIGITPSQLNTIFDAFAQADESMSRRFGGTGLGTTISKQLVELMRGTISAKSEYGRGSVFECNIPLKVVESPVKASVKEVYAELPQLSILVVDDIEQNIELLSLILKRNNHNVSVAKNGKQALLKMENEQFDIVLMDIQMPVMDGLTAARKRREFELNNRLTELPIIALTASVLPQDRLSAEQSGMNGFANKPIDIRQLMKEIANTLAFEKNKAEKTNTPVIEQLTIDLDKGIDLWGSKTALFTEVKRFIDKSKNGIRLLKPLIKKQDWKEIEEISHKYKGVTGNLALNRLMLKFKELEQIASKKLENESSLCVMEVEQEIEAVSAHINKTGTRSSKNSIKNAEKPDESRGEITSTEELHKALLKLEVCVRNNQFDEPLLDALQEMESKHFKEVNSIVLACNDFDFELALKEIEALIGSLKSTM